MAPEKRNGGSHRPDCLLSTAGIFIIDSEELREELLSCIKQLESNNCAANKTALANCYAKLHNDSLNEEIAKLYAQAAELGYAPAQNLLGRCYQDRRGVEKMLKKLLSGIKELRIKV